MGVSAMRMLDEEEIHLVLLDIIMPDMDGYEVLREMQKSEKNSEIPVLVISSVDDMGGVVKAIDLGAVDFLPKDVDPKLLKARVESSLEKKRLRDLELAYLRDVARMTDAARVVRESGFNPERLSLGPVLQRKDSLGELARVFGEMASDVYRREVAFRRQIDLLRGGFLLIVIGVMTGLYPALAKILVVADYQQPGGNDRLGGGCDNGRRSDRDAVFGAAPPVFVDKDQVCADRRPILGGLSADRPVLRLRAYSGRGYVDHIGHAIADRVSHNDLAWIGAPSN